MFDFFFLILDLFVFLLFVFSILIYFLRILKFKKSVLNCGYVIELYYRYFENRKNIFYWFKLYKKFCNFNYYRSIDNFVIDFCSKRGI